MGGRLHAERGMHQGVRLRRQSALPARHGARRDREGRQRASRAPPTGRGALSRYQPRRDGALASAARHRGAGAVKRELQLNELEAAREAGIDALVAVYHSDHRELCAHERDWPFRILNILEVVGESMGLHRQDRYKQLKIMQDADQIVAECSDLIAKHALDANSARNVIVKALLGDQPLPLKRGSYPEQGAGDITA